MIAAGAGVRISTMPPYRYASEIQRVGPGWYRPEFKHKILPFTTMGTYAFGTVNTIHNVVGNLMWHCIGNAVIEVFSKYIWVVADQPLLLVSNKHPRYLSLEIKYHID